MPALSSAMLVGRRSPVPTSEEEPPAADARGELCDEGPPALVIGNAKLAASHCDD